MSKTPLIPILICSVFSLSAFAQDLPSIVESIGGDPFGGDPFNSYQTKPVSKQADITKSFSKVNFKLPAPSLCTKPIQRYFVNKRINFQNIMQYSFF